MKAAARSLCVLMAVAVGLSGCATSRPRKHPEFHKKIKTVERTVLLTVPVNLMRVTSSGDHEYREEASEKAGKRLRPLLVEAAKERKIGLSEEEPLDDAASRLRVKMLYSLFEHALRTTYPSHPSGPPEVTAKDYRLSLGRPAITLAQTLDADALLMARLWGARESAGQVAKRWGGALLKTVATLGFILFLPGASNHLLLDVALVDGRTGEILWVNRRRGSWALVPSTMRDLVEQAFSDFPEEDPKKKR